MELLVDRLWLSLGVWMCLYISDYALTLVAAQMYYAGANQHVAFQKGYELTPYFERDIALLRRFSPRFLAVLVVSCGFIALVWYLTQTARSPQAFEGLLGYFLLLEAVIHLRHLRNISLFRAMLRSRGVRGRIEYSHWLSLRQSALEMIQFAVGFTLVALVFHSWFFAGGAAACLITARQHREQAEKESPDFSDAVVEAPAPPAAPSS